MNILLSNDDGYRADGIRILEEVLSSCGYDIYVSAPDSEQSGKSHGMTIKGRVALTEYAPHHFHVSGTPADCIVYSHRCTLFPVTFDAVISGINHGYNLSTDIIYSGTCAAARQAALYGMKAIAISCGRRDDAELFHKTAEFLADHLEAFMGSIPSGAFMNINVPPSFNGEYEAAGIGGISYADQVVIREERGDVRIVEIEYADLSFHPSESGYPADHEVCGSGKASVSIIDTHPALSSAMRTFR